MRRLILLLFLLLAIAILANSQAAVHVSGADGLALLKNLTDSSLSNTALNNTTNNSTNNTSTSSSAAGKTDDFWSWGSKPKSPPENSQGYDYLNDTTLEV